MNDISTITESMNELIPIRYNDDRITILARDLHEFLEVQAPYHKWFPRMCEYGFAENVDYITMDKNVLRADGVIMPQTQRDAQLTIEMAKEICMLQRNERGKQARQYFIKLEKDWNSPEKVMARALLFARKQLEEIKVRNQELQVQNTSLNNQIEQDKPKVEWADQCLESSTTMKIGDYAKLIHRENDIEIGQNRLFNFLRNRNILNDNNMPYQEYMDRGWFEVIERPVQTANGTIIKYTPKITPKGQQGLLKVIKKYYNK